WDSLSKWFIVQFYFTKTIATMQKSNGFAVAFFGDKGLLSQALWYSNEPYLRTQLYTCFV
ncbi:hypothetical protein, partial [Streptococcus massiliensis]